MTSVRLVELRSNAARRVGGPAELDAARAHFRAHHWVRLPQLLDAALLEKVLRLVDQGSFETKAHHDFAVEDTLRGGGAGLLQFVTNDETLFSVVDAISGCGTIGCFVGRVYRFAPSSGHGDDWHDDMVHPRMLALTVNLSRRPYEGAALEIQDARTGVIERVENQGLGDAVLFELAPHLSHRNTALVGDRSKTAWAGWFCREPSFRERLRRPTSSP